MNSLPFFTLWLLLQIYIVSELGGISTGGDEPHVADLILTKSGKTFLRYLSKEEEGDHDSDNEIKVP